MGGGAWVWRALLTGSKSIRRGVEIVAPRGLKVVPLAREGDAWRVELVAEGVRAELEGFLKAIEDSEVGGLIRQAEASWADAKNEFRGFEIVR
mgnify:CR=1 FL=1